MKVGRGERKRSLDVLTLLYKTREVRLSSLRTSENFLLPLKDYASKHAYLCEHTHARSRAHKRTPSVRRLTVTSRSLTPSPKDGDFTSTSNSTEPRIRLSVSRRSPPLLYRSKRTFISDVGDIVNSTKIKKNKK